MAERRYPNESEAYRLARDALIEEEAALLRRVKAVAEQRRALPRGGAIKEDYTFRWATDARLNQRVRFSELFGDKSTLLLYSFMFGPSWDKPCPSCTSIVDGFNGIASQIEHDCAFVVIGKASAEKINAWATYRGWSSIQLVSGADSSYQADYRCQTDDDRQYPTMHVFQRDDEGIFYFWGTELTSNDLDMVWPYWNLMDMTPAGRPDRPHPPQPFRSAYLEAHYTDES